MARDFSELEAKMTPAQIALSDKLYRAMKRKIVLADLRKQLGVTQTALAKRTGIKQPNLSKLERGGDMQLSTLMKIVEGMDGELEIIARLPKGKSFRLNYPSVRRQASKRVA